MMYPVKPPKKTMPPGATWLKGASSSGHRDRLKEAAKVYDRVSGPMNEREKRLFVDMLAWMGDMPYSAEKYMANHQLTKVFKNEGETWVLAYGLLILYGPEKFAGSKMAMQLKDTMDWTPDLLSASLQQASWAAGQGWFRATGVGSAEACRVPWRQSDCRN